MKRKKILSVLITAGLVLGLVACGNSTNAPVANTEQKQTESVNENQTEQAQIEMEGTNEVEDIYADKLDRSDEGFKLVWNDEFEGDSLDTAKWSYQYGTGSQYGLDGWGNSELQYYTDKEENVRVEDGKLIITAIKEDYEGKPYTSARIRTITDDKEVLFGTKYGRVEARIKLPKGEGIWPAFWMLPVDTSIYNEWAASGEIDIMEARGRLPEKVEGTAHYGKNWPNNVYKGEEYFFKDGTDITDYHLYSVEWEPGIIRWYVDNECYFTMDKWYSYGKSNATDYTWPAPFDVPFHILLNVAVGGTFDPDANLNKAEFPAQMEVDFVRVYQKENGYESVISQTESADIGKDTESFESYAASYEDGEFIVDKEFTTLNLEAIRDTNNGIVPDSKDWQFAVGAFGGAATASIEELEEGKFAKINITKGGNQNYAVQLIQHMPLIEGYTYQLTFDAKATVDRDIVVAPSGDGDNSWLKYGAQDIALGKEMQTYSYVFKMNTTSDPTARMEFNLGLGSGNVWIGNVSVKLVETEGGVDTDMDKTPLYNGNVVYNGTFDQGTGRLAFWHMENMEVSVPDFEVLENGTEDYSRRAVLKATGADAKLYQNGLQLAGKSNYGLSFDFAGDDEAEINVKVIGSDGTVYIEDTVKCMENGLSQNLDFETADTTVTDTAQIVFSIDEGKSVKLDNIKVVKVD